MMMACVRGRSPTAEKRQEFSTHVSREKKERQMMDPEVLTRDVVVLLLQGNRDRVQIWENKNEGSCKLLFFFPLPFGE